MTVVNDLINIEIYAKFFVRRITR